MAHRENGRHFYLSNLEQDVLDIVAGAGGDALKGEVIARRIQEKRGVRGITRAHVSVAVKRINSKAHTDEPIIESPRSNGRRRSGYRFVPPAEE